MRMRFRSLATLFTVFSMVACAPRETPSIDQEQPDLFSRVNAYQEAHNAYDVEAALAMFSGDAQFEVVGMGILPDLDSIRAIHNYDKGIRAQIEFTGCIAEDLTVACEVGEDNDWLTTAGLGKLHYPSSVITFTADGKIQRIVATMSAEGAGAMGEVLSVFIPWLQTERPEAAATLFNPDGHFIYSEENGRLVVQMLTEWRSSE